MSDLCIKCQESVTGHKRAVTCDACEYWQHRLCDTGKYFVFLPFMNLVDLFMHFNNADNILNLFTHSFSKKICFDIS